MFRIHKINNSLIFSRNNHVAVWSQDHNNFELDSDNMKNINIIHFDTSILPNNQLLGYHENEYTIENKLPFSGILKFYMFIKRYDIEDLKRKFHLMYIEPLELIYKNERLSNELLREKLPEYFY